MTNHRDSDFFHLKRYHYPRHIGAYNSEGVPHCPDINDYTKAGVCDSNLSIDNADNLVLIAGGIWFSDEAQCNRQIPIGLTAHSPSDPN